MGSNGPTPLTTTLVKTPGEAIALLELLRIGCRQRKIEWWINIVLNTFATDAARAAAAAHLARAISIDDLMEQNLINILQQAPMAQGVRLDMDEANATPAPAAEGTVRPTATPATTATNLRSALLPVGTFGLKAIETWGLDAVRSAIGNAWPLLDTASKHERPGTESIRAMQASSPRATLKLPAPPGRISTRSFWTPRRMTQHRHWSQRGCALPKSASTTSRSPTG